MWISFLLPHFFFFLEELVLSNPQKCHCAFPPWLLLMLFWWKLHISIQICPKENRCNSAETLMTYTIPYVTAEGKKLTASSKLQRKIKCVASVIFAIFCSWKNTFCSGEVWQQLTEHSQWGFNHLYCNIKWLCICKYKRIAGNKHPSQPVVSSLVLI